MVAPIQAQSTFDNFNINNNQSKVNSAKLKNQPSKDTFVKQNDKKSSVTVKPAYNDWQKASVIFSGLSTILFGGLLLANLKNLKPQQIERAAAALETPKNIKTWKDVCTDLSKDKSLKDMALPDGLDKTTRSIVETINHPEEVFQKGGGSGLRSLLLYGPPGTGKTTYAKAISKELRADFVEFDVSKLKDKYVGSTEQNINELVTKICSQADAYSNEYYSQLVSSKIISPEMFAKFLEKGDKSKIVEAVSKAKADGQKVPEMKRIVVFADEIDSVMMVDSGANSKFSNDVLNEFKKAFTERLGKCENVITMGATNLEIDAAKAALSDGKTLDKPMLDRFAMKLRVPNPDKKQIKNVITSHYKNLNLVDDSLKDVNSSQLENLAEILARHNVSFRNINDVLASTGRNPDIKKVDINAIKQTLKEMQEQLNIPDEEIAKII